jgi:TPR repeat protein
MQTISQELFRWSEKSAAQGERGGLYWLGYCYRHGFGCEKDREKGKENFLIAAELEDMCAMEHLASFLAKLIRGYFFGWEELLLRMSMRTL